MAAEDVVVVGLAGDGGGGVRLEGGFFGCGAGGEGLHVEFGWADLFAGLVLGQGLAGRGEKGREEKREVVHPGLSEAHHEGRGSRTRQADWRWRLRCVMRTL